MKNKNIKGAAPFICRTQFGDLEIVMQPYDGPVPAKVLRRFARHFMRQAEKGMFFPADPLDVYQQSFLALEKCAADIPRGVKSPEAYLLNAARLIVLKTRHRYTMRLRDEYRAIEGVQKPSEQCGSSCDQELDASCSDDERFSYDANDLAEMLVASPDPRRCRDLANECLEDTFRKLPSNTVAAFRAWIAADGVLGEAARLCGESRFAYYRNWKKRTAQFRSACTWRSDA